MNIGPKYQRMDPSLAQKLRPSPRLAGLLLVLMTAVVYVPALDGAFVFDDHLYVTGDQRMASASGLWSIWTEVGGPEYRHQYYPITTSTFWLQYQLWGMNPVGYHIVNVLLHAINAVLLWRLLVRLRVPAAWLAAAVFAVHPVHVPSVAWIAELKNVLSTFFFLAAALCFVSFFEGRRGSRVYWAGVGLFVAALLSKTATSLLPVGLGFVLWWKQGRLTRRDLTALAPLVLLGAGFALMTASLETQHRAHGEAFSHSWVERCLIAGRAVWFYAGKLVWPKTLSMIYPRWLIDAGTWWLYLFPAAAIAVGCLLWRVRHRIGRGPLAAVGYFVAATAPLAFANVAFTRYSYVADHWQYWASMGLITLLVAAAATYTSRRALAVGGAVALVMLSVLTWQRAGVFSDGVTLWRDTVAKNPGSEEVRYNLAVALQAQGRLGEAEQEYREALRIAPEHPLARNNLGVTLRSQGRVDEAIAEYREALGVAPRFVKAHVNLGDALQMQGRVEEAVEHYLIALEIDPAFAGAHYNLAVARRAQGRIDEAVAHYEAVLRLDPDAVEAHVNLGEALQARGDRDAAIGHYRAALRLQPGYTAAEHNLAMALESGPGSADINSGGRP